MSGFHFDENYYLIFNPDVRDAIARGTMSDAHSHYLYFGLAEGRPPSELAVTAFSGFSELYYLEANPDVYAAVQSGSLPSALYHYAIWGAGEGRDPSFAFDGSAYLADNPDVRVAVQIGLFGSGYEHYIGHGRFEGRWVRPAGADAAGPQPGHILNGGADDTLLETGPTLSTVFAGDGRDTIIGGDGTERLYGEAGDDALSGGDGSDRLFGGSGADTMSGGGGGDVFSFDARPAAQQGIYGHPDIITDFNRDEDKIEFTFATEVRSRQQIIVDVRLNFLQLPDDEAGRHKALAAGMADATRTDNAVSFGDLDGNLYILYERDGLKDVFDPANDILIVLLGVDEFSFEENVIAVYP